MFNCMYIKMYVFHRSCYTYFLGFDINLQPDQINMAVFFVPSLASDFSTVILYNTIHMRRYHKRTAMYYWSTGTN